MGSHLNELRFLCNATVPVDQEANAFLDPPTIPERNSEQPNTMMPHRQQLQQQQQMQLHQQQMQMQQQQNEFDFDAKSIEELLSPAYLRAFEGADQLQEGLDESAFPFDEDMAHQEQFQPPGEFNPWCPRVNCVPAATAHSNFNFDMNRLGQSFSSSCGVSMYNGRRTADTQFEQNEAKNAKNTLKKPKNANKNGNKNGNNLKKTKNTKNAIAKKVGNSTIKRASKSVTKRAERNEADERNAAQNTGLMIRSGSEESCDSSDSRRGSQTSSNGRTRISKVDQVIKNKLKYDGQKIRRSYIRDSLEKLAENVGIKPSTYNQRFPDNHIIIEKGIDWVVRAKNELDTQRRCLHDKSRKIAEHERRARVLETESSNGRDQSPMVVNVSNSSKPAPFYYVQKGSAQPSVVHHHYHGPNVTGPTIHQHIKQTGVTRDVDLLHNPFSSPVVPPHHPNGRPSPVIVYQHYHDNRTNINKTFQTNAPPVLPTTPQTNASPQAPPASNGRSACPPPNMGSSPGNRNGDENAHADAAEPSSRKTSDVTESTLSKSVETVKRAMTSMTIITTETSATKSESKLTNATNERPPKREPNRNEQRTEERAQKTDDEKENERAQKRDDEKKAETGANPEIAMASRDAATVVKAETVTTVVETAPTGRIDLKTYILKAEEEKKAENAQPEAAGGFAVVDIKSEEKAVVFFADDCDKENDRHHNGDEKENGDERLVREDDPMQIDGDGDSAEAVAVVARIRRNLDLSDDSERMSGFESALAETAAAGENKAMTAEELKTNERYKERLSKVDWKKMENIRKIGKSSKKLKKLDSCKKD